MRKLSIRAALGVMIVAVLACGPASATHLAASVQAQIFVSPAGDDANPGTQSQPIQTIQRAQQLVRGMSSGMSGDIDVVLADGFYRMTSPLTLGPADSGSNGFNVVWTAAPGARPVMAGSDQITGWSLHDSARNIWVAQGPSGVRTRQLYVNGSRATRATGAVPSAATLGGWRDPSGQWPPTVEFVYKGGNGQWTEPRCDVASVSGGTINMDQPCWANSTQRGTNHVGPGSIGAPTAAENAYALLSSPGEWYLDTGDGKFYYMPRPGEDLSTADVEAPVLEAIVDGGGTAANPVHNVVFNGIQFSYATWMQPSTGVGFSEVQANYLNQGSSPTAGNAGYVWTQIPANVTLTYDQNVQFTNDAFIHLGAAGLGLGNGSQNDLVKGNVATDVSGNTFEIGNVDMRGATGGDQTLNITVQDNYIHDTVVEFRGGIGVDVGYAAGLLLDHNQIDNVPYSGVSVGWGGWNDKIGSPGLANFSHSNVISNNLIYNVVGYTGDGAAIYSNGQTGSSFATGEHITGNVMHDMVHVAHMVNTDNGTDWMTVTGNAIWNTGQSNAWGWCHNDYYAGEGGGFDHENVSGNWWVLTPADGSHGQFPSFSSGNCQVVNNTPITGPSGVPASVLGSGGLEPSYQGLLSWTQAPNPPVGGGCSPTMSGPTNVVANPGTGQADVTWTAPAPDCAGAASYYAVYGYSAAAQTGSYQVVAGTSVTFTGLTSNSYYIFIVTAFDGHRWSAWSSWSNWALVG